MRASFLLVAPVLVLLSATPVRAAGPVWTVRDIDQFQDNFASDGTITGAVRADMANDILPASSPGILPGDSSVVVVTEPGSGLATDPSVGGDAVYCYVTVVPNPYSVVDKSGAILSGGSRWPFVDTQVINSRTWTRLRFDHSIVGGDPVPGNYCIDLNDNLFTPGDTIFFFYGAKSADGPGTTNYFSLEIGTTSDITAAATFAMEFTCLPAGGFNRGGDMLYVDGANDGVQIYWDSAFRILGVPDKVDRYDVRGAVSGGGNRLTSRVVNIAAQINACYQVIWWDCGALSITLGDGGAQKTDDYGLLNDFLGNLTSNGGVLLFGDDVAEQLASYSTPSATTFKDSYMPFTLVSGDHAPTYGLAPAVIHWPGRAPSDDFVAYAAGTPAKDFDVLQAFGTSRLEATYGPNTPTSGAVVSNQTVNGNGKTVTVITAGFSLADIRDDETNGISDRAKFLRDITRYTGTGPGAQVTTVDPSLKSSLVQNYPNPFNPQTTIAFSLVARGRVSLAIYDVSGRIVRTLANETRAAGAYELTWDGLDDDGQAVASGVYFYRLVAPDFTQTKKMVLLK
jgi:FlgD Ig-like domain